MEPKTALLSFLVCLPFSSQFISWPNKNLVLFRNKQANKPQNRHFLWIFNFSSQQVADNEEEPAKSWQGEKLALCWSFRNLDKTAAGCLPQGCCLSLTLSWDRKDIYQAAVGHFRPVRADNLLCFGPLFIFFSRQIPRRAPQTQNQPPGASATRASSPTCTPTLQGKEHILGLSSSLFN